MSSVAAPAASPGYAVRLAQLGDERLALRVAEGDVRAFAAIYERYHQQLFRYCRSILREDGDAQDALQSTFERAFSALQRGQRTAPLRPWLFRIAHNESISVIRRRGADEPCEQIELGSAASVEHTASERARLAVLLEDLADLPERPRGALVMRELGDLSHEEIALALEISVGAAKQAIFEARRSLAECVEGRAMACEEVQRKISDGDRRALRGRRVRAHMRDCAACAAFAAAIPERQVELRALTPVLAPAAAAAIFARATGSAHAAGFAGGGGGLGAGAALGKAGMATAALGSKAAVVAAVVATAAAGAGGVVAVVHLSAGQTRSVPAVQSSGSRASSSASVRSSAHSGTATVATGAAGATGAHPARQASAARSRASVHASARAKAATHSSPASAVASPTTSPSTHAHAGAPVSAHSHAGGNSVLAHSRSHGNSGSHRGSQHVGTGTTHHRRVVPNLRVPPTGGPKVVHHGASGHAGAISVAPPAHKS